MKSNTPSNTLLFFILLTTLSSFTAAAGMLPQSWKGTLNGSEGHQASGQVVLMDGPMGAFLKITELSIDRVPDGRVILTRDFNHRQGLELARLDSFSGEVSYSLPEMADAASYDSLVIWCEKFSVEIGRARLAESMD